MPQTFSKVKDDFQVFNQLILFWFIKKRTVSYLIYLSTNRSISFKGDFHESTSGINCPHLGTPSSKKCL